MDKDFYVTYSKSHCESWDGNTINEIQTKLGSNEAELVYDRNILACFFGTLILSVQDTKYHFNLSKQLTHSKKPQSNIWSCVGRNFSGSVEDNYGCETGKVNSGFVICEVDEEVEPYVPGDDLFIPDLPEIRYVNLIGKTLFQTYDEGIINEVSIKNDKVLFQDKASNRCYVVIDGYKVFVSHSVAYLTEEQLTRAFDKLTFYSGAFEDGPLWFTLGLPKELKFNRLYILSD